MTDDKQLSRSTLVSITIVLEGVLLLAATIWSKVANLALLPALIPDARAIAIGAGTAVGTVLISLLLYKMGATVPFFKGLRKLSDEVLQPVVSQFTWWDIVLVSLTSGICEEVLFRGVMLPLWGLTASSVVFGLVHSPNFKYIAYVLITILAGYLFGYLYLQTHSLWTPCVAHVLHNLISLAMIRNRKPRNEVS